MSSPGAQKFGQKWGFTPKAVNIQETKVSTEVLMIALSDKIKRLRQDIPKFKAAHYSEHACGGEWDEGTREEYKALWEQLRGYERALDKLTDEAIERL